MKRLGIPLLVGLVAGGIALQAQTPPIPFHDIAKGWQPGFERASNSFATTAAEGYSSSAIPASAVIPVPRAPEMTTSVMDRHFLLFNGLHLGMALFDVGMTQHCIAEHRCKEGNPLMPSSMAGQFGVTLGLFAYSTGGSYLLKKHRTRSWWIPPVTGIVTHAIGVASGLALN